MKKILILIAVVVLANCKQRVETQFSEHALNDVLLTMEGQRITLQEVLTKYKGKKILIDVWATWCGDCLKSLPSLTKLQRGNPEVIFLFFSIDDTIEQVKLGIQKYKVKGEHYWLPKKWDSSVSEFLGLSWIPRFLVIDEKGKILVFNETTVNSEVILNALN